MNKTAAFLSGVAMAAVAAVTPASAKPINSIGVTLGSLGNPYFVALTQGATAEARKTNPQAHVIALSADYDLNKQFSQIDNFIASGVQLILINAVDPQAILPAIKRAQAAGIVVVAVDVKAAGADATVQTDNVEAGRLSCAFLAKSLGGKGNVAIQNGPQVSAVIDRVTGCKQAFSQAPGIHVVTDDQNGQGSRDGGFSIMQGYLVRYPNLNGVFTINDPQAVGSDLAIRQGHGHDIIVTSVDGAPDFVSALKSGHSAIKASSTQDPYQMGANAVDMAQAIINGHGQRGQTKLMAPVLVNSDNVGSYRGWTEH
jgi:ribose transport system substrate-binding protein